MDRIIGLGAGCALVTAALAMTTSSVRAQAPSEVTITFRLTLSGTVPTHDSFVVNWAENGIEMCNPCTGNGHTYTATMRWPKGNDHVQFVFSRFSSPPPLNAFPRQTFGRQTVVASADRIVTSSFSYGNPAAVVRTPATGGAPPLGAGAALALSGGGCVAMAAGNRRRRGTRGATAALSTIDTTAIG